MFTIACCSVGKD